MENNNTDPMPSMAGFPVMPTDPSVAIAPTPIAPQPIPIAQQAAPTLEQQDTPMMDAAPSLMPATFSTPLAPRTSTPVRNTNGVSAPEPAPMPSKAAPHGAPARRYLNEKVTGVLLEGMKRLAAEQYAHLSCNGELQSHGTNEILMSRPENPLQVLGEYLLQRSKELEGGPGNV
ncbi:hypothetical protein MMC30_000042 [Trapelia coarctata]|nr:hypothetical protein [Trapelia coarctata]